MWQEWWLRDKALALILCHSQKTFSGAVFTPRQSWFWTVTCRGSGLYSALIPPSLPLQRASSSPWPFDVKFTERETFKSNAQGNLWRFPRAPAPTSPPSLRGGCRGRKPIWKRPCLEFRRCHGQHKMSRFWETLGHILFRIFRAASPF